MHVTICKALILLLICHSAVGQRLFSDQKVHHLRIGDKPQWAEFPAASDGGQLALTFDAKPVPGAQSLFVRHYSVELEWIVTLNDQKLGKLSEDEKDMISFFEIPAGLLKEGQNTLQIAPAKKPAANVSNDIRISEIFIESRPVNEVLSEATLELEVRDGENKLIPSRITIADKNGVLMPLMAKPGQELAIRQGFVYTGNGKAMISLPAGTYRIFATRGFEYAVDSALVTLKPGDVLKKQFKIKREVATDGWVSSDTHIHTFTHSRHGDATDEERILTIAGEGIELPIITDHNLYADLNPAARKLGLNAFFTIVNGIEVTTPIGHFNMFPIDLNSPVIDHKISKWDELPVNVMKVGHVKGIILNHARDLHSNFRPFDPSRHIASAGMTLTGWKFPANAMEVINSGATQSDIMRLYDDWFGLLNRGYSVTPAGSTDTHTVSRFLLGQARTYIKTADQDPAKIDITHAIDQFTKGRVMVSYGLLTELVVNKDYASSDTVQVSGKEISVSIRVSGPGWTTADQVALYANGKKIRETKIANGQKPGLKWTATWNIPAPEHDVHLVAIAEGPGEVGPFWQIAKPYQPTSTTWIKKVMGSSGAVFVDADRDKSWSSAHTYAERLIRESKEDIALLVKKLAAFDEAVAIQAAAIWQEKGHSVESLVNENILKSASVSTKSGFRTFAKEYQLSLAKP
ncbi:CehA/McbA family metallohydrolase [Dyadobacter aurulentus]|uniref:CehA/McbA family metallohydrolase n=1 Tax=Dyadobacter sp. UC 10 TaxID=2605428 RepID=UPI0011F2E78E|nr:CehA/McbA family metallohydrolase [Dyadobacter sp. UC 10]KAA0992637.1 hypothetical protein FXO21_21910 [Dyadobacter sp. UC 10]